MKKTLFIVAIVVFLIIINNLVRSIYSIWQKDKLADDAEKQLAYQKGENTRLKSALSYVQTQEFIEKEARDKLFMIKPNESIVLDSEDIQKKDKSSDVKQNKPNWEKWVELFF